MNHLLGWVGMGFHPRKILPCELYYQKRDLSGGVEKLKIGMMTVTEANPLNAVV
jgi:hypothetical protein